MKDKQQLSSSDVAYILNINIQACSTLTTPSMYCSILIRIIFLESLELYSCFIMPSDYNFKAPSKMDRLNLDNLVQSNKKRPKRPTKSQGLKNKATYLPQSVMIQDWDDQPATKAKTKQQTAVPEDYLKLVRRIIAGSKQNSRDSDATSQSEKKQVQKKKYREKKQEPLSEKPSKQQDAEEDENFDEQEPNPWEEEDDQRIIHEQLRAFILTYNKITGQTYHPQIYGALKNNNGNFAFIQKYYLELLKNEIQCGANRDIDEREDKQKCYGAFQVFQEGGCQFFPQDDYNQLLMEYKLLKGPILGVATYQCKEHQIPEYALCFVSKNNEGSFEIEASNLQVLSRCKFIYCCETIITYIREYLAIKSIASLELKKQLFSTVKLAPPAVNDAKSAFIQASETFKLIMSKSNKSQHGAIKKIVKCDSGIFLIQGPPGTGKTSTILNLISLQHSAIKNKFWKQVDNPVIMVCCQSNGAVDDVCRRMMEPGGLMDQDRKIKALRIGRLSLKNKDLIGIYLYHICEKKFIKGKSSFELQLELEEWKLEHRKPFTPQLKRKQKEMIKQILAKRKDVAQRKEEYDRALVEELQTVDILLGTLSSTGKAIVRRQMQGRVCVLLIDEACQATVPSSLVPIQLNPTKIVLIGDPMQLQPTVLSNQRGGKPLCETLFERLSKAEVKVHLLNTQYRMHPTISSFSNRHFYNGKIHNGRTKPYPPSLRQFVDKGNCVFFFDLQYTKENKVVSSFENKQEAEMVILATKLIYRRDPNLSIGIITPYKCQAKAISENLVDQEKILDLSQVKSNTVDSFQGQERNVIIMSMVRANQQGIIGFVAHERRLNVSLTRAQDLLIIFGNRRTLQSRGHLFKNYFRHHQQFVFSSKSEKEAERQVRNLLAVRQLKK